MPGLALARAVGREGWLLVARGVVALVGGAALVGTAHDSAALLGTFGMFALVDGLLSLVLGGRARWTGETWRGTLGVTVGLLAAVWPGSGPSARLYVPLVWCVLTGVAALSGALELRRVIRDEILLSMNALLVLGLAVGLVALRTVISPGDAGLLLGFGLVASSVLLPGAAVHVRRFAKQAKPIVRVLTTRRPDTRSRQAPGGRENRP
jgi:uncharacterized membrane protein HdeD (DUF308 family)